MSDAYKLRLLIVDDSAYNRRHLSDVFVGRDDVEVVGRAGDGEEALRLCLQLRPDVITLDLEMPRMDGFTFLRILMAKQPTPVIVVSSYSQKENVFKALELGALDFVAKPDRQIGPDAEDLKQQVLDKVLLVRSLRPAALERGARPALRRASPASPLGAIDPSAMTFPIGSRELGGLAPVTAVTGQPPRRVVVVACSTGGPSALLDVVGRLPPSSPAAFVFAQHMPDKFTRTFAERLGRRGTLRVTEAQDGDTLLASTGFVCPGRQCAEVIARGSALELRVGAAATTDRFVPSADRLFKSVAAAVGPRAVGVVLTGMGDDGTEGARAIREAGGTVLVESQETAVVYGMPGSVERAGLAHEVLALPLLAERLAQLS